MVYDWFFAETFEVLSQKHAWNVPSEKVLWYYTFFMIENKFLYNILTFLLHTIPAYIVDFVAICFGKKPL